jgi:predicted metalloprotease
MKIKVPGRRSENMRDMRTQTGGAAGGLGGGIPFPIGKAGAGLGLPIIILMVVLAMCNGGVPGQGGGGGFGVDSPFNQFPAAPAAEQDPNAPDPEAAQLDFVSFVLDDVQETWQQQFLAAGNTYTDAQLVVYRDFVQTGGCGNAPSSVGPFYCPADETVYLDLGFFDELATRFDAPGDFAQAYVIAHELGHHVQNLTGINDEVRQQQQRHPDDANELSVRLELQADCLAGVWGHSTYQRGILESGDLEEGLTAAAAVGDDRIQEQATGTINKETWTHGSSEDRMKWFRKGFDSGDAGQCNTFD